MKPCSLLDSMSVSWQQNLLFYLWSVVLLLCGFLLRFCWVSWIFNLVTLGKIQNDFISSNVAFFPYGHFQKHQFSSYYFLMVSLFSILLPNFSIHNFSLTSLQIHKLCLQLASIQFICGLIQCMFVQYLLFLIFIQLPLSLKS